jgi:hypothetical protein
MTENIVYNSVISVWIIFFAAILALALGVWFETKKSLRFKTLRIVAVTLAVMSLTVLVLRPSIKRESNSITIILTPGYVKAEADSLKRKFRDAKVMSQEEAGQFSSSSAFSSYHELNNLNSSRNYVLGNGIPSYALEAIDAANLIFLPGIIDEGLTDLSLPNSIIQNDQTSIHFSITDSIDKVVLEGPGGRIDSVQSPKQEKSHTLRFIPKEHGNFVYVLKGYNSNDAVFEEKVPVVVQPERAMKILFVQDFPTFEVQYLKRFLAPRHNLVLRYRLSQNSFRYETVNQSESPIGKLDKTSFEKFDLVIIDSESLSKLSSNEKIDLATSISNGLGMFIMLKEADINNRALKQYLPQIKKTTTDTVHIRSQKRKIVLSKLPQQVQSDPSMTATQINGKNILSGYRSKGFGKIGFTLLQETYQLFLEGDSSSYSAIWTSLLEGTARKFSPPYEIQLKSPPPYRKDEPLDFDVRGINPRVIYNNNIIPLRENLHIDNLWHGRLWPDVTGWNTVLVEQDSSKFAFYVADGSEMKTVTAVQTIRANKTFASQTMNLPPVKSYQPVSMVPFYLLFLLSAGFLWLAPKI